MPTPWVWPPLLACAMLAPACGPKHPPAPEASPAHVPAAPVLYSVQGTASYREPIDMPANAVFEAMLEDVSRLDAPAVVLASVRIEQPGNVGIPYEIGYDRSWIVPSRRYAVRGRILVDGELFFVTDQHYPVLTSGAGNQADLLLRRVSNSAGTSLENSYWKLTHVGAMPVPTIQGAREPHLMLDGATGRASGFSGCNSFAGGYEVRGDLLILTQTTGTLMACVGPGLEIERAFLDALKQVKRWKITGRQLELLDTAGATVARFEQR